MYKSRSIKSMIGPLEAKPGSGHLAQIPVERFKMSLKILIIIAFHKDRSGVGKALLGVHARIFLNAHFRNLKSRQNITVCQVGADSTKARDDSHYLPICVNKIPSSSLAGRLPGNGRFSIITERLDNSYPLLIFPEFRQGAQ